MSWHIGPRQYDILRAIRDGQELWKESTSGYTPRWRLDGKIASQERCAMLHLRGFLMSDKIEDLPNGQWRQRFLLTDKGKAAL